MAAGSAGGVFCGSADADVVEVCGWAFAGGAEGAGGLGLVLSCLAAEGAEGRSSDLEFWAKTPAANNQLPSNHVMPRNFIRPQL